MQNDREIKKAITVSRALKKKDAVLNYSTDKSTERFMWANSVVRDELQRPLVISDAELHYIQHEEVKAKKKLEKVPLSLIHYLGWKTKMLRSIQRDIFMSLIKH